MVYKQPLRQTEGFVRSLVKLMAWISVCLGSVDVHLSHKMVAARDMNAVKLLSVLQ